MDYTSFELAEKAGVALSTVGGILRKLRKKPSRKQGKAAFYSEETLQAVIEWREKHGRKGVEKDNPPQESTRNYKRGKTVVVNPVKYHEMTKDESPAKKPLTDTFNLLANGEPCERCGDPAERIFGMGEKSFTLCKECRKLFVRVLSLERVAFMPPEDEAAAN